MFVIGLTGSLASGKTTVATMFKKCGAKVIHADNIVHQLLKPSGACYKKVVAFFGRDVCRGRHIDRKALATIVFRDARQRKKLESLIHPEVKKVIRRSLRKLKKTSATVVLDVPLLFESGLHKLVDVTVVVVSTQEKQLYRAHKYYTMTKAEALRRIKAQMPLRKKIQCADFIIDNNGTKKQTEKQVKLLWQKL